MAYGWAGEVETFLRLGEDALLRELTQGFVGMAGQFPSAQQTQAWEGTWRVLSSSLAEVAQVRSEAETWGVVLEYELPLEGGRRPDVVLLAGGTVVVLEFKEKSGVHAADLDQAGAYARDLAHYHAASHKRPVYAALLLTRLEKEGKRQGDVAVVSPDALGSWLLDVTTEADSQLELETWLNADYAPLPSIIQAARRVWENEPLPAIRRAESAGIPQVMVFLNDLAERARAQNERHAVLITGVPGAGKTLVGLQFAYETFRQEGGADALFLSGNGPLVEVLQYALKSKTFVRPIRNFYLQHEVRKQGTPKEHLIVFDEAQRAWDAERMGEKYGVAKTAPELIMTIAERLEKYAVTVFLIGEGQEIHLGEEEGVEQYARALGSADAGWQLHGPEKFAPTFATFDNAEFHPFLDLTTSLRSHLAKDVQTWVGRLLGGDLAGARALSSAITAEGFALYVTRDLDAAKAYCVERYAGQSAKRYGLLASSKAKNLPKHGVNNDFMATRRVKTGPFYIDPPGSPASCCQLDKVVTEFACQGLELDFPVVCWGSDLRWDEGEWRSFVSGRSKAKDPHRLRLNSYRVLLTRGRDGFVVFVPPDENSNETFEVLLESGLTLLA